VSNSAGFFSAGRVPTAPPECNDLPVASFPGDSFFQDLVAWHIQNLSDTSFLENPGEVYTVNITSTLLIRLLLVLAFFLPAFQAKAREIVDLDGRTVRVPDKICTVYGASPPVTSMLYAMDPSFLVGWNAPQRNREDRLFLPKRMRTLPVIGGWYGQGQSANIETLIRINPDLVLISGWQGSSSGQKAEQSLKRIRKPIVHIKTLELPRYADTFRFLGRLLRREARGQRLAEYAERSLAGIRRSVEGIPESRKVRVYYAEGIDGLSTECDRSIHAELIQHAGGRNVLQCSQRAEYGMEKTTLEQVLAWNPQVIVVQESAFYQRVFKDPRWKNIRAVMDRKVYLVPKAPFNWFDRPPSYMRLIGIKWLANILYPERVKLNMVQETREFYRLFLHTSLSDAQITRILNK
jgi:iron complex transport system substrate-binding protein